MRNLSCDSAFFFDPIAFLTITTSMVHPHLRKQIAQGCLFAAIAAFIAFAPRNFIILEIVADQLSTDIRSFSLHSNRIHMEDGGASHGAPHSEGERSTTAIFMNAFIAPHNPTLSVDIVHEQLRQLANATHHEDPNIFYNIIGHNHTEPLCPEGLNNCKKLAYYEKANEEVTLQALHNHCTKHEDDFVIYIHNKGSFHSGGKNTRLRRIATKGAFSEACSSIQESNSTCNVCAFRFQTVPFSHVPGNFWAANCRYVRKLVPPRFYERARRDLCKLIIKVHGPVDFCPKEPIDELESSVEYGFGRMAMERWIPSHPSFIPCDVLPFSSLKSFDDGWEPWTPRLAVSRKTNRRMRDDEKLSLKLLAHEHALLYGPNEEQTFCHKFFPFGNPCPPIAKEFKDALANETTPMKV
jgi:hypothetical protein